MHTRRRLGRHGLSEAIEHEVGVGHALSSGFVEEILTHICEALEQGEEVKIARFGTFFIQDQPERQGRNPRTGELHPVAARRAARFRPSRLLRARLLSPAKPPGD